MAKRLSSQHFTVISSFVALCHEQVKGKPFDHSAARADRVSWCSHQKHLWWCSEGNVMEGLSISVVTVANRHCEIESRSTIAHSASDQVWRELDEHKETSSALLSAPGPYCRSMTAKVLGRDSSIACRRD